MKLKLLVKLGDWLLGKSFSDDEPRADMYLPVWLLAFALVLVIGGVAATVYWFVSTSVYAIAAGACAILLGVAAFLCWKNQSIVMLSNDAFEYTTFLGNKKQYRFSEITGLRQNNDSMTLFVGDEKVHIESCAIMTKRLIERLDQQLEQIYGKLEA